MIRLGSFFSINSILEKYIIAISLLFISFSISAQTSIYNIQYTTQPGSGTYPSLYEGQNITTGGIVTATDYMGGRYFISSSQGGAWNGLFVYDNNFSPNIGDSIIISGLITEYQGYTEIKNLTSVQTISSSNALPPTTNISTANITSEAYEGVFVEINGCSVTSLYDSYGNWEVNDGSGVCGIRPGIFDLREYGFPLYQNYTFQELIGVVGINYSEKYLHPRSINDFKSDVNELIISSQDKFIFDSTSFEHPINLSILNQTVSISSYSLEIQYNSSIFEYTGYNKTGTISELGIVSDGSTSGNIVLSFNGNTICDGVDTLIKLIFNPLEFGDGELLITGTTINGTANSYTTTGTLEYMDPTCDLMIGDTLTIVQSPLLNIPSIVLPNQELSIVCFAPQSTINWNAELFYEDVIVSLNIIQSDYDGIYDRWTLTSLVPNIELYELYNLRVSASGGIVDTVANAVKVIDQYKTDYNFIHITDTHLPGQTYYGEAGYETDYSELDDLYEVIKDINLINPEFVLLTGDMLNEGELEDFECLRNHTLVVDLLQKFKVPVYIVPGNHDLGGWDDTPPVQGTARNEWWRFFGWRQRETPPSQAEYQSHDYSFNYGNIHFTGLEAYDNYDGYMDTVYGYESFTPHQLTWLNNDLAAAGNMTKVLFYHYDFKNELNLSTLGVDMALWGHNHNNTGDINTHPYNLSTASTCNGNQTYRVIRVNGDNLQAENSIQSNSFVDMLTIDFNTVNDGTLDLVSATINNNHDLSFDDGLVKFIMPNSQSGYIITNGTLKQVLENGTTTTCYVNVDIPSNGQITVTIEKATTGIFDHDIETSFRYFPSPFEDKLHFEYEIKDYSFINISIHNMAGQHVKTLVDKYHLPGQYNISWDSSISEGNAIEEGNYIINYKINGKQISSDQVSFIR